MKAIRYYAVLVVLASLIILSGCGTNKSEAPKTDNTQKSGASSSQVELRWGTAPAGGAMQVLGSAMLEDIKKANPNITGSTVPGTPVVNIMSVHEGKNNISFSLSDATADAWNGKGEFEKHGPIQDIREVAATYLQFSHIAVWADSDIKSIEDLKGKRVSPGAKGLSSDVEFARLLKLYGLSYDDMQVQFLSFDDATQLMIDKHLDALFFISPPPFASIVNISSQKPIRLLSIPDDKLEQMAKYQGIQAITLPPGVYKGIDYPVKGINVRSHIIVREDMPDDVVYNMVKTIAENFDNYKGTMAVMKLMKPEEMAVDVGIPFHPGALKYYKEKGWIK